MKSLTITEFNSWLPRSDQQHTLLAKKLLEASYHFTVADVRLDLYVIYSIKCSF